MRTPPTYARAALRATSATRRMLAACCVALMVKAGESLVAGWPQGGTCMGIAGGEWGS